MLSTTGTPVALSRSYTFTVKVIDSAGNSATQLLTLMVASASLPAVTIVDPVFELLDGPKVTTVRTTLALSGAPVEGISADGIAQVVFRIPTLAAGDQVTATIFSDQCSDPSICSPSTSSDEDGGYSRSEVRSLQLKHFQTPVRIAQIPPLLMPLSLTAGPLTLPAEMSPVMQVDRAAQFT